ncbi:MAG: MBL fold metallo-hydrolase [Planctomycetota bacterium]
MTVELGDLRFHNGGYCWQSIYLSGVPMLGFRRFHAVFLEFDHPVHGHCLIDTGYGPDIWPATRRFPQRFLRWFTPIPKRQTIFENDYPNSVGIDPDAIDNILISHFHADHIGGLKLFPKARFLYRKSSYETLVGLSSLKQMDHAFVPKLLPEDFVDRGFPIDEELFVSNDQFAPFKSIDFWGDGSLFLIDLPGHAIGHTGYCLNTERGRMLYVVDSFWDQRAWRRGGRLPFISRRIHHSYSVFVETQLGLSELCKRESLTPLACHCPETQAYV